MIMDDAAELLSQADFFDICDEQELAMLGFAGDRQHFAPGEVIYRGGTEPHGASVLVRGTVLVEHQGIEASKAYHLTEPGSVISPTSLIIAKPRPVTFTAETECELIFVPRSAFLKLAKQSPSLAQRAAERIQRDLGQYMHALEPLRKKMVRPAD